MNKGRGVSRQKRVEGRTDSADERSEPALRTVPIQARALQSVDVILNTAAQLLDEVGLERFNTNLLAERANVRVRTVYRYFPNKYAVLLALAQQMTQEWDDWMDREFAMLADPKQDWETEQRRITPSLLKKIAERPGELTLLKSMGTIPGLIELDNRFFERWSLKMSAAFKQRGVALPTGQLRNICRVSLMSTTAGVDQYFRLEKAERPQFLSELINMQIAYLRLYL
jgi:AcrR family transcriptional regulator